MNDSFQVLKYRLYENQICKTTICEDFLFFQRDIHQNFNNFVKYKSQKFSEIIKSTYNQTTLKMIHPHECLIPNNGDICEYADSSIYNCKLSIDGDRFIAATNDGIRVYEILDKDQECQMKPLTFFQSSNISWTITDIDLSLDKRFLIQSTLNPLIQFFNLEEQRYSDCISLDPISHSDYHNYNSWSRVYCVRISGDSKEIMAGCGKSPEGVAYLKIYDINEDKVSKSIPAHKQDINSINYIDKNNSSIFLSASDDCQAKIWDVRALGIHNKPVGFFLGHHYGLTYIDSKGDEIYVATNSKDQSLKLWDLRKLASDPHDKPKFACKNNFDYRYSRLDEKHLIQLRKLNPKQHFDNSVMSFYGHEVLGTLIRCHFSPRFSTNSRFIYSGSSCGSLFIYDTQSGYGISKLSPKKNRYQSTIRDALWHNSKGIIFITNFNGCIYKWDYKHNVMFTEMKNKKKEEDKFEGKFNQEEHNNDDKSEDGLENEEQYF